MADDSKIAGATGLGRAVPRGRLSRFAAFGKIAGGVAGNVAAGGARALARGDRPVLSDLILTPANATRVAAAASTLGDAERRVLPLLDGATDLQAVVERSGISEFEVGKAVYGLLGAGLVSRVGRSATRHGPL